MTMNMSYLSWHYKIVWVMFLVLWRNLTLLPYFFFSVPLHIGTLFAPWKRYRVQKDRGFDVSNVFYVVGFNITARIIGAIVRCTTILFALILMPVFFILGLIPVLLWPLTPIISLPIYLIHRRSSSEIAQQIVARNCKNIKKLILELFKREEIQFAFERLAIDLKAMKEQIKAAPDISNPKLFRDVMSAKKGTYTLADVLFAASFTYQQFRDLVGRQQYTPKDLYQAATWYESMRHEKTVPFLLSFDRIKSLRGIGVEWAYGYTPLVDKFAKDLTKTVENYPLLIGRDHEIGLIEQTLVKSADNNVLIIGDPGTARHQLVETISHRIMSGNTIPALSHKRILQMDMHALTAVKDTPLEVKGYIAHILEEAEMAGNVVLFIDEFDRFVSTGPGRIDLTDVFFTYQQSSLRIIGMTTPSAFHALIEPNQDLTALFEKIEVHEVSPDVLMKELTESILPVIEKKYHVLVTYPAILKVIEDADRFISSTPFPGKAVQLLDEVCVYAVNKKLASNTAQNGKKGVRVIQPRDVDALLSQKLNVNIGSIQTDEKNKLVHLEELIHTRVINQETAVAALASSMRRSRMEVASRNKPVGTFLFLGPTGVGKTETAKALCGIWYGSEDKLVRFDMSQYQMTEGLERLIGSVKLGTAGELTSKIRDNPFSVILLDEFEKADRQVFHLFLPILDEGYITDALGRIVDAKNTIIIATSNAGSEFIREQTQKGLQGNALQEALLQYVQEQRIFAPELLNRFDAVVVFAPLSEGHLREVVRLQLSSLNKRLEPKKISVKITPELVQQLVTIGYDPAFGARAVKRVIAEHVEDQIAKKLLDGSAKQGVELEIDLW